MTHTIEKVEGGVLLTIQRFFNGRFFHEAHVFATPSEAKAYAAANSGN